MSDARAPAESAQGIWPDGSSGAIEAAFCKGCRLVESSPKTFGECSGADFETVPILPASLCEELAAALEEIERVATNHPSAIEAATRASDVAHSAVARYREAVAEGVRDGG